VLSDSRGDNARVVAKEETSYGRKDATGNNKSLPHCRLKFLVIRKKAICLLSQFAPMPEQMGVLVGLFIYIFVLGRAVPAAIHRGWAIKLRVEANFHSPQTPFPRFEHSIEGGLVFLRDAIRAPVVGG
jgi:hypothetical protein